MKRVNFIAVLTAAVMAAAILGGCANTKDGEEVTTLPEKSVTTVSQELEDDTEEAATEAVVTEATTTEVTTTEATTTEVHNEFKNALNESLNIQNKIYNLIIILNLIIKNSRKMYKKERNKV